MSKKVWHNLSVGAVVADLQTNKEKGLTREEIIKRQKIFGLNQLPEEKFLSKKNILIEQFKSPLIYILVIAGIGTAFFRLYTDAAVILLAIFINTLVGFFQENKATEALRELKKIVKIESRVIIEGEERKIDSKNLVPGDIIILSSGDKVPADGRLIENYGLKVNESPLTGEWFAAEKKTDIFPQKTVLADRDNMVYMGCIVESGKAKVVVTETGKNTEIGKIAYLLEETKENKTPLQEKISSLSKKIGIVITLISIYIFLFGLFQQQDFIHMFEVTVAVAVAAIPEGLPVALTVILALGMTRILKRHGLVRKLLAAETLGSTSIIATDKTLTLTKGEMEVAEIITFENTEEEKALALKTAVLCSQGFVENPNDIFPLWEVYGEPTDKAFILAGGKASLEKHKLEEEMPEIDEIPFDPKNKFIASLRREGNNFILYVSGAPEKIISLSARFISEDEIYPFKEEVKQVFNKKLKISAKKGLRIVAVGHKKISHSEMKEMDNLNVRDVKDLVFEGFINLKDPIRKEAKEAMRVCRKAGMFPIIVTGDHKFTAMAVAEEVGFRVKEENVILGEELDMLSDEELDKKIKTIKIYSRVEPRHKLRIVQTWQRKGEVVAMTGDGINDAPALKKADIGVALGSSTDVAKEVSDLVLLNDNFNVIVASIEEGRAIIDNIRKVITYLLSDSFSETILVGISIILGWPLPVIAVQILWVNLIEDGLPNIALTFEPKEKDLMERKPEGKNIPLLNKEMKVVIFIIGIVTDFFLLGLFAWLWYYSSYEIKHIQSIIFAALTVDSLFYVFSCKSLRRNIWNINIFSNKFLIFSWIAGVLALLAALYLPFLQTLLKTTPLNLYDWKLIMSIGFIDLFLIEITKWFFITKKIKE